MNIMYYYEGINNIQGRNSLLRNKFITKSNITTNIATMPFNKIVNQIYTHKKKKKEFLVEISQKSYNILLFT